MTPEDLRREWRTDLERREGALAVLFSHGGGVGSVGFQVEVALIRLLREHMCSLQALAAPVAPTPTCCVVCGIDRVGYFNVHGEPFCGPCFNGQPFRAQFVGGPYDDMVVNFPKRPPMVYQVPVRREVTLQGWLDPDPTSVMFPSIPTFDYMIGGLMAPRVVVYYPAGALR